jgi:hypothetical protein
MTPRTHFKASDIEAFKAWLIAQGHEWRAPISIHELLHVRVKGTSEWYALYHHSWIEDQVSLVKPLIPLVHQWLKSSATPTQRG